VLAEVGQLERVGTAREACRHDIFVIGRESTRPPKPLSNGLATSGTDSRFKSAPLPSFPAYRSRRL